MKTKTRKERPRHCHCWYLGVGDVFHDFPPGRRYAASTRSMSASVTSSGRKTSGQQLEKQKYIIVSNESERKEHMLRLDTLDAKTVIDTWTTAYMRTGNCNGSFFNKEFC